jgi:D-glycero-D-manno-heptose 1,7-bisphosphate phosphatase
MRKAIFLDRDGVLNKTIFKMGKKRAPYNMEEFELLDGVEEGIKTFKQDGFLLIVVTNQPDVARGWVDRPSVEKVNHKIKELLAVDDIKACYHIDEDNCSCRKPRAGMLLAAADKWGIDLKKSFMIGDRFSDIAAGVSAGCRTALIGPGDEQKEYPTPDFRGATLEEAAQWIHNQL